MVASLRHSEVPAASLQNNTNQDDDDDEMEAAPLSVEAVGFCPSNPLWCATAGVDGVLKIWDLGNNGQCRHVCRHPPSAGVTRLQWLPSNNNNNAVAAPIVATATTAGSVHLWEARTGAALQQLTTGSHATLNDLEVLPAGGVEQPNDPQQAVRIVTAGDDHVVRVFEVQVQRLLLQSQQQQQQQQPAVP